MKRKVTRKICPGNQKNGRKIQKKEESEVEQDGLCKILAEEK